MEKILSSVGSMLYGMRFTMLFFYVGLVGIIFGILGKFLLETFKLMNTLLFGDLEKIGLIIKVLELVDHRVVACPNCQTRMRAPSNKGKITIRCPKCKTSFETK